MSTATEIQALLRAGRSLTFDWFSEQAAIADIAETMVAVANHAGATLVMGVEDGQAVGVSDRFQARDRLIEAALSTEPPLIIPLPRMAMVGDKPLMLIQIPSGMPHVYAYSGRYLRREGTENIPLAPNELRYLMIERGDINFEANVAQGATLDDLDWNKAEVYAHNLSGFSDDEVEETLLKRGCLVKRGDELRPTNAGILLFGRDPQRHIIGSDITAVRFAGETMSDTFSRQDIGGTLPDQIKRAATFLHDHLRKEVMLKEGMQREEFFEYPMEAARELVVNAVAHRAYSIRGDNIRLLIFSDRLEVYSPGGLPGPMTLQNLRSERFSRNPIIVQVLADLNYIEKLGYGVDRVMDLMRAQNLSAPEFHESGGGFRVTLRNATFRNMLAQAVEEAQAEEALPTQDDVPEPIPLAQEAGISFDGVFQGQAINPRQETALLFLHLDNHTRITNRDLKRLFPDVHPETIRRDLADLVQKGILLKQGQKRGSYYVLKETEETQ